MRNTSGKSKIKQGRGKGEGVCYLPWILAREFGSLGTRSLINDWKHGRQINTLSRNETYFYYILRWDDDVIDVREQFPLDRETTQRISDLFGIRHPVPTSDPDERMTTDFLVTYRKSNGAIAYKAYSVKDSKSQVFGDPSSATVARMVEKQTVEMAYWRLKDIPFKIVFGDTDINKVLAINISVIVDYYNLKNVQNDEELLCYLLAHKYIIEDMDNEPLDIKRLTLKHLPNNHERAKCLASIAIRNGIDDSIFQKYLGD